MNWLWLCKFNHLWEDFCYHGWTEKVIAKRCRRCKKICIIDKKGISNWGIEMITRENKNEL